MKHIREYLPTGELHVGEFRAIHHEAFHQFTVISRKTLRKVAESVVKKWNAEQPDTWHYEVLEEVEK